MYQHFSFFDIEPAFIIDEEALKTVHIALQKEWHPDFHASDPEMHTKAVEITAANNQAYHALSHLLSRVGYILGEHGMVGEGEKNQLPQAFLMEMLDINDIIDLDPDGEAMGGEAEDRLLQWDTLLHQELHEQCVNADAEKDQWNMEYLHPLLLTYQKIRYVNRLRSRLEGRTDLD